MAGTTSGPPQAPTNLNLLSRCTTGASCSPSGTGGFAQATSCNRKMSPFGARETPTTEPNFFPFGSSTLSAKRGLGVRVPLETVPAPGDSDGDADPSDGITASATPLTSDLTIVL